MEYEHKEIIRKRNSLSGDCLSIMESMQENEVDAVITDPPYDGLACFKKGVGRTRFKQHGGDMEKNGLVWDCKPSRKVFEMIMFVSQHQIIWGGK